MPKNLFTALAAAIFLCCGMLGGQVNAMMPATASAVGAARDGAALLQRATVICGSNGCATVQTKRVQHPKKLQSSIR
jgi:hypothetical protein